MIGWELFCSASRVRALVFVVAMACATISSNAAAQASAYVPLDDIAYTYVDALVSRGWFRELSMLERPFTERALRVAID